MAFFERIACLERERASFAIATVVARRSPVSSHLGDRAVIFADGRMDGFVGGSCSRDIVRRHAVDAIRNRHPVLLQIRPDAWPGNETGASGDDDALTECVVIPMSCASEGAVDVYIEPRVPLRRLVVVGFTPIAESLARAAASLEYDVVRVVVESELRDMPAQSETLVDGANPASRGVRAIELKALGTYLDALDEPSQRDLVAIVASQGHYDELALEIVLARTIGFVGLLASRRRAANVFGVLTQQGIAAERIATIANPVGLDIGARSPGDVAVSILAQIVERESPRRAATGTVTRVVSDASAIDPICGMDVDVAGALYQLEHAGRTYYFCCAGCRASFAAAPPPQLVRTGPA